MENKINRIEEKIDKIKEDINSINVIMAKNTEQLSIHIKRTELLEERMEHVDKHVTVVNGVIKIFSWILSGSVLTYIIKYLKG